MHAYTRAHICTINIVGVCDLFLRPVGSDPEQISKSSKGSMYSGGRVLEMGNCQSIAPGAEGCPMFKEFQETKLVRSK